MATDNLEIIGEINRQLADLDEQIKIEILVSKRVELMAKKRNLQQLLNEKANEH
jgi:hypothetical protein